MLRKITAIAGIILALSPFMIFPVCESLRPDGTHMACWYSGILITVSGAVIFVLSFVKRFPALIHVIMLCLALLCWIVPNRIADIPPFGLCADMTHSCRAVMIPAVGVISMIIVILCAASLAVSFVMGGE